MSDLISRQAAIALAKDIYVPTKDGTVYKHRCIDPDEIRELPPVTPRPKTGRWIMPQQDDGMSDPIYYQVRCSKCNFDLDPQTWNQELHQYNADKYCPNCGARMEGQE